ncbi:MAG: MucBP domain-containing protein [Clostridia bacterium]|nr:MucBP domain-containing protein [Clostridia bacterium]
MKEKTNKYKWRIIGSVGILVILLVLLAVWTCRNTNQTGSISPELARAMNYAEFEEGDDAVEGTDNVKFSAFFLRDLDGDDYAEKLKGTCKEIGNTDVLYMEVNVQTAGFLKDAKIQINGQNFYLQTALVKDNELKNNYIGNNIKQIEFNQLASGTQKLITGVVRSGDYSSTSNIARAIGDNINNYSREDNEIILTGTYVDEDGNETPITKKVDLTVDWYGTAKASFYNTKQTYRTLYSAIDESNQIIKLDFAINIAETEKKLILSKSYVEGVIPELNGYAPSEVILVDGNANFIYDEETRAFTIQKEATIDSTGNIIDAVDKSDSYKIQVTYPLEAYKEIGVESVELRVPVQTYYEGYNNANTEFKNPYTTNKAKATVQATIVPDYNKEEIGVIRTSFQVKVGKNINSRQVVSKEKPLRIYNGISDSEKNDTYLVTWYANIGTDAPVGGLTMKETKTGSAQENDQFIKTDSTTESMENVTKNVGIYFGDTENLLGEDGWIKVYNDETDELLVTFDETNLNEFTNGNPYEYETPVKHIRLETSTTKSSGFIYVYNVKELDDDYITTNYTEEEFENLQYIKSSLALYLGNDYMGGDVAQAVYQEPYSIANIGISKNSISTQQTEENEKITIKAVANENYNQVKWENGSFLVKLPPEIILAEINDVTINNTYVQITSYEVIEQDGIQFIKINTENTKAQTYNITIDANLTPDPRLSSTAAEIELYASNGAVSSYSNEVDDIYDINDNLNTQEKVNKSSATINLIAPNSLLTSQTATNYDEKGSITVSPQVSEIKPIYSVVDKEENTADIGVQIKNNYTGTISELTILGKIPFEGNTYVISGRDMGSMFTTKMTSDGIQIPEELQGKVTVYYSENENPGKELDNSENGWNVADDVSNWDNIKTFLIDFNDDYVMDIGKEYEFKYTIKIPNGINYNQLAFSNHGVFFSLDTEAGKYKTQIEPNRLGFAIVDKYNLELSKYQAGKDKLIQGATYRVVEEGQNAGKTAVTNTEGKLTIKNLYAEKIYAIKEIKTPDDYDLNEDVVKIIGHVNDSGELTVEKLEGTTREDVSVEKNEGENYKAVVKVEDEAKARLRIVKKEKGTENLIQGVRYKITGAGLPESGLSRTTQSNGETRLSGLKVNEEYTLQEVKADGYYLASPVKVKLVNDDGTYELQVIEGEVKESSVTEEDSLPIGNVTIEGEKIPTYSLEITKIKKIIDVNASTDEDVAQGGLATQIETLAGAKFELYKGNKEIGEYITGEDGKLVINNLYQYVEGKDENATYTLKEVLAPVGYAKVKDITFKVQEVDGELQFQAEDDTERNYTSEGSTLKLQIADSPSFRLVKKDKETQEIIPNVKFAIYNVENGEQPAKDSKGEILGTKEVIDGKEYYTVTTNENGEITADLQEGLYKAVEVQAPDKYDISNQTYYFGIGASREGEEDMQVTEAFYVVDFDAIISMSDGGYIVGGTFSTDTIQVGDEILTSAGSDDIVIAKYNADDEVEWARSIGGSDYESIYSIAETSDGGCIVGGSFRSGTIQVGNETLTNLASSSDDAMIIEYSAEGEVEWATSIGDEYYQYDYIYSVKETSDGGLIVGGAFESETIQLGNITLTNGDSAYTDAMIIKYTAEREVEWARSIGAVVPNVNNRDEYIESVMETNDGGYLAAGSFESGTIQVGNETLTNAENNVDGMIIKYNEEGEVDWVKRVGGSGYDYIYSATITSDGGIIARGSITYQSRTSFQIGNETLELEDYGSIIIKIDAEGITEWVRASEDIETIIETSDGGYIAGARFEGTIQVGNETLTSVGSNDVMIIKYSAKGEVEWTKSIGGSAQDYVYSVAELSDGSYIAGVLLQGTIQVEAGKKILTSSGSVILKYEMEETPNIVEKQEISIGETDSDEINSVAETSDGGYIAGGYFKSSTIQVGNEILTNVSSGNADGMITKYNAEDEVEWTRSIGGSDNDFIKSVLGTSDGGYIVGGVFSSSIIQIENETLTNAGSSDGMIIKYTAKGEVEWTKNIGGSSDEEINSVAETSDGGYIVVGGFSSSTIQVGNETLTNAGSSDGMIIKYSAEGEVEWVRSVGGNDADCIKSVTEMTDGGIIVGGEFKSSTIQVGNETLTNLTPEYFSERTFDGMIIKYTAEGEVEWAKIIGGSYDDGINSVKRTGDGGFIAGGYFESYTVQVGNETLRNSSYYYTSDGMIIKYNAEGEVEFVKKIGGQGNDYINSVLETIDKGIVLGGSFESSSIQIGNETLTNAGNYGIDDGMIIKYYEEGGVEFAKSIGGTGDDIINSVIETKNGAYVAAGSFQSSTLQVREETLTNAGSSDGMIVRYLNETGVPEVQEVIVENVRKEFKITTDIKEIDGTKGGSISGEDKNPYEKVKYGDSNTKEIKMIPDEGYEIISITVNGEDYKFETLDDGTFTMPMFTNITEDKHIEVTYCLIDNKIIINKVDAETKEPLSGAKFKIDQVEERTEPEGVIGEIQANGEDYDNVDRENKETLDINLIDNGATYESPDTTDEIEGVVGTLTNNGTYYFVEENGTYIPTNIGIGGVTANSYIPIDLTSKTGSYIVDINATISSESRWDYGYATVTETTEAPSYDNETGRFMYISGEDEAKDYTSMALEGGKIYYLHLGYRKDGGGDYYDDRVTINSVKVYEAITVTCNFIESDGKYVPNNTNVINTVANSYIPIDLSSKTGKYAIVVNAETQISGSSEYLYATVAEDTTAPAYDSSTNQFMKITGTQTAKDYVKFLDAGKIYYLHLGYKNDSSLTNTAVINSVELYQTNLIKYKFVESDGKYESNNQGIDNTTASSYIPIDLTNNTGKYNLIVNAEISSENYDYGYVSVTETEPTTAITYGSLVNISGTTQAKDYSTVLQGGKMYYLQLAYYKDSSTSEGEDKFTINSIQVTLNDSELYHTEVESNSDGQAITQLPFGKYAITEIQAPEGYILNETPTIVEFIEGQDNEFTIENEKESTVTVHHFIRQTTMRLADDEVTTGKVGEEYTTAPQLDLENYELEKDSEGNYIIPENAIGTISEEETEVTYYYQEKESSIETPVITKTSTTEKVTELGQKIPYTITYTVNINEYVGDGIVTITDELPYAIDTEDGKSNLDGGTYDETNKTITWTENIEGIDTYTNGKKQITITKNIEVTYKDLDITQDKVINTATGTIELPELGEEEAVATTNEIPAEFLVSIKATKTWQDNEIQAQRRPTSVILVVKNGDTEVARQAISASNQEGEDTSKWSYTFTGLNRYDENANEISYTVDELEVQENDLYFYSKEIGELTGTGNAKEVTITNTFVKPDDKISIKVNKVWVDEDNIYQKRPASLELQIKNATTGDEIANKTITVETEDSYTFTDLEKYDENGTEIIYTADEKEVNAGDLSSYVKQVGSLEAVEGQTDQKQITITNTMSVIPGKVIVKYVDKSTSEEIADPVTKEGMVGETFDVSEDKKDIEGYTLIEEPAEKTGTYTAEEQIKIYYYAQNTKATVLHIDKVTGDILKQETKEGKVGDLFETKAEDIEDYVLVERPEEANVVMTKEEIIVRYYYAHISKGVIEKHIDDITGEILYTESHEGNEGDEYNIPSRTIEGYDVVESKLPENAQGKMTQDVIEVKYYYIRKVSVKVEYIDKATGEKIIEDVVINGHENEEYTTEAKEFPKYVLEKTPENATGEMTITKNDDGSFNTEIVVQYYYIRKDSGGVLEKHIDFRSNKILAQEQHDGKVGDEYNIPAREFENYKLVQKDDKGNSILPTNSKGTMEDNLIEVNYYYVKQLKVTVEYINRENGELIDTYEIIGGEGYQYEAEDKEFDGYNLEEIPANKKGIITDTAIVVKYYYNTRAELEVKYLEKGTENSLLDSINIVGKIGDSYETEQKDIPYYNFVESTDNVKGTMAKNKITVIYYYEKQVFNFKVDGYISDVTMDGVSQGGKTLETKDELYKLDIHRKKVSTADVRVTYTVCVSNVGEIEGSVDKITDIIPDGFSYHEEDNLVQWENNDGILTTTALKGQIIKPGESKEFEITLRWNNGDNNFGQKDNVVIIGEMSNPAGYQDVNQDDNRLISSMLLTVATGLDTDFGMLIILVEQVIILVICAIILIVYKKKEKAEKNTTE